MERIVFSGQINKTYRVIAGVFAFGVCLLLKGKKKKSVKKHIKRYNKMSKHSYNILNLISNKITVQNVKNEVLDYEKCLEIYKKTVMKEEIL